MRQDHCHSSTRQSRDSRGSPGPELDILLTPKCVTPTAQVLHVALSSSQPTAGQERGLRKERPDLGVSPGGVRGRSGSSIQDSACSVGARQSHGQAGCGNFLRPWLLFPGEPGQKPRPGYSVSGFK